MRMSWRRVILAAAVSIFFTATMIKVVEKSNGNLLTSHEWPQKASRAKEAEGALLL
jgi:hypothetical protein